MKSNGFYCVYCRDKKTVSISSISSERDVNGKPRVVAKCPACKGKMFKYISECDQDKYKAKRKSSKRKSSKRKSSKRKSKRRKSCK